MLDPQCRRAFGQMYVPFRRCHAQFAVGTLPEEAQSSLRDHGRTGETSKDLWHCSRVRILLVNGGSIADVLFISTQQEL